MAHTVLVYASELAAAIGRNKYKQPWTVFESLWRRVNEEQYQECVNARGAVECTEVKRATDSAVEAIATATQNVDAGSTTAAVESIAASAVAAVQHVVQAELQAVWQNQPEVAQKLTTCKTAEEVKCVVADATKQVEEKTGENITRQVEATVQLVQKQVELEAKAVSEVQCKFGTVREAGSRVQVQRSGHARDIHHDNKFHIAWMDDHVLPVSRRRWGVGGRLDGLDADGRVVEIKNRARHFFARVPDYEYVQVQAYMHMMDVEQTLLVQQLDGQQRTSIIHRCRDEWNEEIVPALYQLVSLLDLFVDEESYVMRAEWVRSSDAGKQSLLAHWLEERVQDD